MLDTMKRNQRSESMACGHSAFRFTSVIAGFCVSKAGQFGLRSCKDRPIQAKVCKTDQLYGRLCIFGDITLYLDATSNICHNRENFFLSVNSNYNRNDITTFYNNMNLGEHTLPSYIKAFYKKHRIIGEGD